MTSESADPTMIPPSRIEPGTVPIPIDTVDEVGIDGETVLVDGWRKANVVSASGMHIWNRIDGTMTLAEIAAGIAEELEIHVDSVTPEVLAFARQLGRDGFFVNVDPNGDGPDVHLVPIEPTTDVGTGIDDVETVDAEGNPARLLDIDGETCLLIHWSPHCGYCSSITDLLASLEPRLKAAGIDIALFSHGGRESNQTQLAEVGWHPRVLLKSPDDHGPFIAHGTPAAYHLDRQGTLLAPAATGTDDVVAFVAEVAGVALDAVYAERVPAPAVGFRYLLDHGGSCAVGSGAEPVTKWAGTGTWHVGDYHVGLRFVTDATASVLDTVFGDRVAHDPRAGHLFTVDLGNEPTGDTPDKLLTIGSNVLVRSRYSERVLRALLWHLDDRMGTIALPLGSVQVMATAVQVDSGIALLPPGLHGLEEELQPAFARHGIAYVDVVHPVVDFASREVVIPNPTVPHDSSSLKTLSALGTAVDESEPARPGRYPLIGWGTSYPNDQLVTWFTPAQAAAAFVSRVLDTPEPAARMRELGNLFARVPSFGLTYRSEQELADGVATALELH